MPRRTLIFDLGNPLLCDLRGLAETAALAAAVKRNFEGMSWVMKLEGRYGNEPEYNSIR